MLDEGTKKIVSLRIAKADGLYSDDALLASKVHESP